MSLDRETVRFTVEDDAAILPLGSRGNAIIRNLHASATVYLGGDNVTDANGFPLKAGEIYNEDANKYHGFADLYAIVATGTAELSIMIVG